MGQSRRQYDHLFTIVLIVLVALVCGMWVRSRNGTDALMLFVGADGRAQVLASSGGRVCLALTSIAVGRERAWTAMCGSTDDAMPDSLTEFDVSRLTIYPPADPAKVAAGGSDFGNGYLGFSFAASQSHVVANVPHSKLVYAVVPHWAIALPLVAWSSWRLFGPAAERRRRLKRGLCLNCGYDVRASAERCPECGEAITKST